MLPFEGEFSCFIVTLFMIGETAATGEELFTSEKQITLSDGRRLESGWAL